MCHKQKDGGVNKETQHSVWQCCICYVIVIAQVPGVYGSKQTGSEGVA